MIVEYVSPTIRSLGGKFLIGGAAMHCGARGGWVAASQKDRTARVFVQRLGR